MNMLEIICGDALEQLRMLPAESVQCCVTSPPYWGLRDYSCEGQLGLERTPEEYVRKMVELFREVRRVLRKDGTLWLNLGDSFVGGNNTNSGGNANFGSQPGRDGMGDTAKSLWKGLPAKNLIGIPWRVAFALQADGWWLRSDIIWAKPNPMPESCTDRPTKSHEYMFLMTKSSSYFYDAEAIKEAAVYDGQDGGGRVFGGVNKANGVPQDHRRGREWEGQTGGRNKRSVWTVEDEHALAQWLSVEEPEAWERFKQEARNKRDVWKVATAPYPEAHFATYPPDLIKPCILAGTSAKGCCAKCGAPWERVVEKVREATRPGNYSCTDQTAPHLQSKGSGGNTELRYRYETKVETLGWRQNCECMTLAQSHKEPVPCTVLDPFAGSGTTGMVALELGRKAILIELNPKYVELIRERCNITPGLQLA